MSADRSEATWLGFRERAAPSIRAGLVLGVGLGGFFDGIVLLARAWRQPGVSVTGRTLLGSVLMGFGLFNLVEGIVDHHLLVLHRVWPAGPGPPILWDVLFLVSGVALLVGGYAIVRSDSAVVSVQ